MGTCCNKDVSLEMPSDFEYQKTVALEIQSLYASQLNQLPHDNKYE
jgi:hypothetical protein